MRLTLRQLEVFAVIARAENVSKAALTLAMSQSAASSALLELERQFDCPLFDRIGKSLHLNATGRGLLPLAENLLAQARDVEAYLGGSDLGPLQVGATLTIGNYLATLIVADYMQQHPGAPVRLHVANTEAIVGQLLRFECDLGLIEGEIAHRDLVVEPWLADELVVFCAPQHPLAQGGAADTASLARQAWILREPGSGEALRRGSLIEVQTPQFDLRRHFYIARHRQRHLSAAASRLLDLCRALSSATPDTRGLQLPYIP